MLIHRGFLQLLIVDCGPRSVLSATRNISQGRRCCTWTFFAISPGIFPCTVGRRTGWQAGNGWRHHVGMRTATSRQQLEHAPVWRDMALVVIATLFGGLLAAYFELSESIFAWTRGFEHWQLDELPALLTVL